MAKVISATYKMLGSLGFLKPDLPKAASPALNPVSRATVFEFVWF